MAETLDFEQFAIKYNEYNPSGSGHDAHRKQEAAKRVAWAAYQETGEVPWEATAPTEEVTTPDEQDAWEDETTPTEDVGPGPPTTTPTTPEEGLPPVPEVTPPELAPAPEVTPAPTVEAPEVPAIPEVTPAPTIAPTEVAPAPEYKPTEEEAAWAEMYGGTIADIIKARGEGIPEETVNLMIRQQAQALNAREDENLRLMHNDMERRGITNSGLVFWNQQKIKGATTTAIANSITDIQIKSALMKMASFENALGHAGQFLGYLQEQSKMIYTGKMATWEAQTQADLIQYNAQIGVDVDQWKMTNQFNLAEWDKNTQALFAQWDKNATATMEHWKLENQFSLTEWGAKADYDMAVFQIESEVKMAEWSAKTDIYKMGIAQAYAQNNIRLAGDIAADAAETQFENNKILLEMKLEADQQAAAAEGAGTVLGGASGLVGSLVKPS